jgi:CubicO group peptidase (beta-lactamase class C family)
LFRYPGSLQDARTEVAATMLARAPEAKPGERFLYSNAGYMIAGAIAERAGGAAFEELLTKELFAPLGMASAGFGAPGDEQAADQPWGHRRRGDALEPVFRDNPPAMAPAGTVHCSLRDWAKFAALHLGVPTGDAGPLLSAKTLAELHAPPAGGDYALGWGVTKRPWAPGPVLTHSGSNTMWFCVAWLAPEPKFGVLVACNQGDASKACDAVAAACVGRYREAAK